MFWSHFDFLEFVGTSVRHQSRHQAIDKVPWIKALPTLNSLKGTLCVSLLIWIYTHVISSVQLDFTSTQIKAKMGVFSIKVPDITPGWHLFLLKAFLNFFLLKIPITIF